MSDEDLTEYELTRRQRISVNQQKFDQLDLIFLAKGAAKKKNTPKKPRTKKAPSLEVHLRRSSRVSVKPMDRQLADAQAANVDDAIDASDNYSEGEGDEETSSWGRYLRKELLHLYPMLPAAHDAAVDLIGGWLDASGYTYTLISTRATSLKEDDDDWKREHGIRAADLKVVKAMCAKFAAGRWYVWPPVCTGLTCLPCLLVYLITVCTGLMTCLPCLLVHVVRPTACKELGPSS